MSANEEITQGQCVVGQYDVSKVVISSECCDCNDKSRMWVDKTKSELSGSELWDTWLQKQS